VQNKRALSKGKSSRAYVYHLLPKIAEFLSCGMAKINCEWRFVWDSEFKNFKAVNDTNGSSLEIHLRNISGLVGDAPDFNMCIFPVRRKIRRLDVNRLNFMPAHSQSGWWQQKLPDCFLDGLDTRASVRTSHKKPLAPSRFRRANRNRLANTHLMSHRIRHAFAPVFAPQKLAGSVEIDEAMFGVKNKPKMQVVALVERGGEVRTKIVDRITHRNIGPFMRENIAKGSTLNTDANPRYNTVYLPAIKHESVNHSAKEFIREKADGSKVHVNHCESFFSLLKRGVTGAFHHISKEHLHRYCDEFSFRWNTRKLTDGERFVEAVAMTAGKRLKYRETIAA
jgi:hypothetical protein